MSAFRDSVYRDAKKAGLSDEMAHYIADNISDGSATEGAEAIHRADTMKRLACLYGVPQLGFELIRSSASVKQVVAVLSDTTGGKAMTAAGLDSVRARLFAATHWG